mgnify:CR=1 FL=1
MRIKNFKDHIIFSGETIRNSIVKLGKLKKQFCIVVDKKKRFKGTLTDGDIRRGLLNGKKLESNVQNFMHKNFMRMLFMHIVYAKKKCVKIIYNPPLSFGDLFEVSAERSGGHLQYLEGFPPPFHHDWKLPPKSCVA